MDSDFQFIKDLCSRFLGKSPVQKRLKFINEYGFGDWEKWLQIEFAYFLADNEDISEWYREVGVKIYSKKKKVKTNVRIDFMLRRKRYAKGRFILLEVKQNYDFKKCIEYMFKDAGKIDDVDYYISKGNEFRVLKQIGAEMMDVRSYWSIGIHKTEDERIIREYIQYLSGQGEWDLSGENIHTENIGNTGLNFTIF